MVLTQKSACSSTREENVSVLDTYTCWIPVPTSECEASGNTSGHLLWRALWERVGLLVFAGA